MKETKVYVDELPKSCGCCEFYSQDKYCAYCLMLNEKLRYIDKDKDCPLKSLHKHDKELVAKVLEKVSIELENETETYCEIRQCNSPHYQGDYVWFNYVKFRKFAKKLKKEIEDEQKF